MSTLREAAEKALMALTFAEESGRHWPMAVKMARNAAIEALRAALSAPAEPQEAAEPVVIAGRYTAYPQRGTPNHCFNAQVFGPDGLSVATFDSTADPRHAYRYAMALADALNAPAPQPAGGERERYEFVLAQCREAQDIAASRGGALGPNDRIQPGAVAPRLE